MALNMVVKTVLLACLLATVVCDMKFSFESLTHVHRYLHFRANKLYTTKIYTNKARQDSTFKLIPGLAEASEDTVSFEESERPGYFVYEDVSGLVVMREKTESDRTFDDKRATFYVRKGNHNLLDRSDFKSFESYRKQGNFLVERNFVMRSGAGEGTDFNRNSTFKMTAANWDGHASSINEYSDLDY